MAEDEADRPPRYPFEEVDSIRRSFNGDELISIGREFSQLAGVWR